VGCVVGCVVSGTPAGLGEPLYGKLHAALGAAMLSINAAKGFDCGTGFDVSLSGSCANDRFIKSDKRMTTANNNSGGIQGGISNGNDIYFRVAFKPIATVMQKQNTLDFDGNETEYQPAGRHDICVSPRVLPVVEAMAAITVFDYMLLAKTARIY
jgi:chorismate synthase